jgi:hypothetical protein
MATWLLVILFLFTADAQFIQHYNVQNGKPHWRRQIGYPNWEVLQPDYPVILEYNCFAMPSICQNVNDWIADKSKSDWQGRAGQWVFTYDLYAKSKKAYTQGTKSPVAKPNRVHR